MPDREVLGIIVLFELLAILYVIILVAEYLVEYWYLLITAVAGITFLKIWWRRRHPLYYEDEDELELEPVPQE